MHADDSFERKERPFEAHYFHVSGSVEMSVPAGTITVDAMKGFEFGLAHQTVQVGSEKSVAVKLQLKPETVPANPGRQWVSGDVHVHMNYGGTYRNTPAHLVEQASAETCSLYRISSSTKSSAFLTSATLQPRPIRPPRRRLCFFTGRNFIPATGDTSVCCT